MKDLENILQAAEKVTTNDLNNNPESSNLHERQATYKVRTLKVLGVSERIR